MKIGIRNSSYYIKGSKITDYQKMKSHGYDCADFQNLKDTKGELFLCSDDRFENLLKKEKEKSENSGVSFSQVHAPWPVNDSTEELRKYNLACMKRAVKGTAILNGKYLVVHPVMPNWEYEEDSDVNEQINMDYFKELCEFALDYPVGICIENMPMKSNRIAYPKSILKLIDNLDMPNLYMCLDTGHCNVTGEPVGEIVRLAGKKLKTFHIHDNNSYKDEHLYPYFGTVDWDLFIDAVRDIGFEGTLSIEADINRGFPTETEEYFGVGLAKLAMGIRDRVNRDG